MSAIVPALDEARAKVERARARAVAQLAEFEASLARVPDLRRAMRRHPFLMLGGAFLTGWAVAQLFSRKR